MISIEQALKIHAIAIAKFDGANGVRDFRSLEPALARLFKLLAEKIFMVFVSTKPLLCKKIL